MSVLDSLFGSTKKEDERISGMQSEAMRRALGIEAPQIDDVALDRYDYLGDYRPETIDASSFGDIDPELASYDQVDGSAYDDIAMDGGTRDAQMAALSKLGNIADSGGMSATDEANMNRVLNQSGTQARGAREAVLANMAARGMSGSGMELLAQMQANQDAQSKANQNSLDIAGMAQSRALDALMQQGNLANNVRGQDFEIESRKAAAKDAINQFNSQNMLGLSQSNADRANQMGQYNQGRGLGIAQYNTGATNQAGMAGSAARQSTANANVDLGNQQTLQNKVQNPMQNFQNQMGVESLKQGAYGQAIGAEEAKAGRKDKRRSDLIGATVKGLGMGASYAAGGA